MNFFGHSVVAMGASDAPAFVLGAMVPDFFSMAGLPCTARAEGALGAGIAHHHRTDEVFHQHPHFTSWQRDSFAWLSAAGVERGPARAVAHIGVELLLDADLCKIHEYRSSYQSALRATALTDTLQGCSQEHAQIADAVRGRLIEVGANLHEYTDAALAERIARILSRRPRLALAPAELPALHDWVIEFRSSIADGASELLAELRAACHAA